MHYFKKAVLLFAGLIFMNMLFAQKDSSRVFRDNKGKLFYPLTKYNKTDAVWPAGELRAISLRCRRTTAENVHAIFDGRVVMITETDSGSYCLTIKYGDYFMTYANVTLLKVMPDQFITKGQKIGSISKNIDGVFEFELLISNNIEEIDPTNWFKRKIGRKIIRLSNLLI